MKYFAQVRTLSTVQPVIFGQACGTIEECNGCSSSENTCTQANTICRKVQGEPVCVCASGYELDAKNNCVGECEATGENCENENKDLDIIEGVMTMDHFLNYDPNSLNSAFADDQKIKIKAAIEKLFADELAAMGASLSFDDGVWDEGTNNAAKLTFGFTIEGKDLDSDGVFEKWDQMLRAAVATGEIEATNEPAFVLPLTNDDAEDPTPEEAAACKFCDSGYAKFENQGVVGYDPELQINQKIERQTYDQCLTLCDEQLECVAFLHWGMVQECYLFKERVKN